MKPTLATLLAAAWLVAAVPAIAQQAQAPQSSQPNEATYTEGEVRKVDKDAQKITLKHGPIVNLEMPEMTMVFRASDPKFLDGVKSGDKVRFRAEKIDGVFTVVALERQK